MGIAEAGLALAAIGTATSVVGSIQQASAQKASSEYNAKVAESNRQIALQNASYASKAGEEQAAISQQKTRALEGSIIASEGASGVDVNTGSYSNVQASEAKLGMLDALTIRSNAARTAYGYQVQATNYANEAAMETSSASNAMTAGYLSAGSSFLSGAGSAASNYADYSSKSSKMTAKSGVV